MCWEKANRWTCCGALNLRNEYQPCQYHRVSFPSCMGPKEQPYQRYIIIGPPLTLPCHDCEARVTSTALHPNTAMLGNNLTTSENMKQMLLPTPRTAPDHSMCRLGVDVPWPSRLRSPDQNQMPPPTRAPTLIQRAQAFPCVEWQAAGKPDSMYCQSTAPLPGRAVILKAPQTKAETERGFKSAQRARAPYLTDAYLEDCWQRRKK